MFFFKGLVKCSVQQSTTIKDIKERVFAANKKFYPDRQGNISRILFLLILILKTTNLAIRIEVRGKTLKDTDSVQSLEIRNGAKLYMRDLGPQIGWKTVFLAEYAGPLLVYLWIHQRPWMFYGLEHSKTPIHMTAQ